MENLLNHFPLHHIAIATEDIDKSVALYRDHLGYTELPREKIETFGAEVAFLLPSRSDNQDKNKETAIELIAPLEKSSDNPICKFLKKRGEGLHHICLSVQNIQKEHERLLSLGYSFTTEKPRNGAHNAQVIFMHPKSSNGVLIELHEKEKI